MTDLPTSSTPSRSVAVSLLPTMAAVLAGFVVIGAALPVLPLHVSHNLGFGSVVVGMVAGTQFAASLVSRVWSGSFADANGGKRAVLVGLVTAAAAGLLYLLSVAVARSPVLSVSILVVGRAVLGGAESFIIRGGVAWGLALVDAGHSGKVIAWVGTAMFAALAFSGPFGAILFTAYGFAAIGLLTTLLPLLVLGSLMRAPNPRIQLRQRKSDLRAVFGAVWLPGLGAALASVGYCSILAFSSLLYADNHWRPVWVGFTAFGAALIAARMICGHLPDRYGGAKIALLFVLVQSAGLLLMGLARSSVLASSGAALAGLGYSLVYPALGVEAVGGTSPESRGLAMGIYTAFLDVAMALGSPALGWAADRAGLSVVFFISAGVTFCTTAIALHLAYNTRRGRQADYRGRSLNRPK
ncbi:MULTISPECIES: arabinose transporter [unclassified Mesorhizobium]|uniref:arabinose transporter n=1 Tax=unclassified Mesorhizobium TaxID=325217 RepID=UPI0010921D54|nr:MULTISPECIES: arabinose transporter [unclassified Mesorhizobium]TGP85969.1 MFS transporter [Mesorhizobium sp. M8A.F.Ca.ET.218.01.1.1]TGT14879.1 MFS transporter [Mesorhizobium sp. M8A.F.Ca.ET.213.01.1.1]